MTPPKPKAPRKKSADKRAEKQNKKAEESLPKIKLKTSAGIAQAHNSGSSYYPLDNTPAGGVHSASNVYRASETAQVQAQQSFPVKQTNVHPTKEPKSKPTVVYQDRPATNVAHLGQTSNPMIQVTPVPPAYNGNGALGMSTKKNSHFCSGHQINNTRINISLSSPKVDHSLALRRFTTTTRTRMCAQCVKTNAHATTTATWAWLQFQSRREPRPR